MKTSTWILLAAAGGAAWWWYRYHAPKPPASTELKTDPDRSTIAELADLTE